jgi:arginyl-tRNA synthetase
MDKTAQLVQTCVKDLFGVDRDIKLTRPDSQFGDFATNVAMQLAKSLGKNPREIAEQLAAKLRDSGDFSEVSVAGPGFINLKIPAKELEKVLSDEWGPNFGKSDEGKDRTVIVEYPSNNMAKPYSVGHLRSGNQGWAVKKLMEATGWNVVTDNHLGDYGAPFGIWVVGFLRYSSDEKLAERGVYELGDVYVRTKKDLKDEESRGETELANQVQGWLIRLENGDKEAVSYSEKFNKISLDHIHDIMGRLKINTDYELGETFFAPMGKKIVQDLLDRGLAVKNEDGSVILPLEGFEVPVLLQKSNGTSLYATTDLATMQYREKTWHPARVIYAVGGEQKFYFSQIFAMAKKLGIGTDLIHLWFGLIKQQNEDGTIEKMSSRKGVVLMEELLDQAEEKARQIVKGRDVSEEDVKKVAIGAIKFSDFISDRRTNILFNWNSIFSLTGFSGPYVQYAAVRINKILKDNPMTDIDTSNYDYEPEKKLILKIFEYPEVVRLAARDLEAHKIASYLYEFAKELNRYYETTPVATRDASDIQKQARLGILRKTSQIFTHGLDLLGMEVPETM